MSTLWIIFMCTVVFILAYTLGVFFGQDEIERSFTLEPLSDDDESQAISLKELMSDGDKVDDDVLPICNYLYYSGWDKIPAYGCPCGCNGEGKCDETEPPTDEDYPPKDKMDKWFDTDGVDILNGLIHAQKTQGKDFVYPHNREELDVLIEDAKPKP